MEKVFARDWFSSRLSVAVARTSQSPFPLCAMLQKISHINQNIRQIQITMKNNFTISKAKFILFSSTFFANAYQHICKMPKLSQQLILQKS
ncbi:hypothetical protein AAH994_14900 [Weeksellaceae bacterium A-14]